MDSVEQLNRLFGLVGLQGADHVQLHAGEFRAQGRPLRGGFLHVILAKDPLALVQHGQHPVLRLDLGHGDQGDGTRRAVMRGLGCGDAGLDSGQ